MANHKPAVDNTTYRVFDATTFNGNLLESAYDQDGDRLRVVQAGGQKIVTDKFGGAVRDVIVEGKYGTFLIDQNGGYTYKFDPSKIVGIGPGQEVTESLSFKISDGRGGTDTAKTTITLDVPEQGSYVVDFEDAPGAFPGSDEVAQGYAGLNWGDEAAGWNLENDAAGNTYIVTDPFEETLRRVDGADFTIGTFKIANAGNNAEQSDAIVTFSGYNDAGEIVSQKSVYVWADDISDGQEISLEDLGEIDTLRFSIERTNTSDELDVPQIAIDDLQITITGTSDLGLTVAA